MSNSLPKYWKHEGTIYKLVCLAIIHHQDECAYVLKDLLTGMNTAFGFNTPGLEAIQYVEES